MDKQAGKYAGTPQLPQGNPLQGGGGLLGQGGLGGMPSLFGMGVGNNLGAAAQAARQNPNPAANVQVPQATPATAEGVQQVQQQKLGEARVGVLGTLKRALYAGSTGGRTFLTGGAGGLGLRTLGSQRVKSALEELLGIGERPAPNGRPSSSPGPQGVASDFLKWANAGFGAPQPMLPAGSPPPSTPPGTMPPAPPGPPAPPEPGTVGATGAPPMDAAAGDLAAMGAQPPTDPNAASPPQGAIDPLTGQPLAPPMGVPPPPPLPMNPPVNPPRQAQGRPQTAAEMYQDANLQSLAEKKQMTTTSPLLGGTQNPTEDVQDELFAVGGKTARGPISTNGGMPKFAVFGRAWRRLGPGLSAQPKMIPFNHDGRVVETHTPVRTDSAPQAQRGRAPSWQGDDYQEPNQPFRGFSGKMGLPDEGTQKAAGVGDLLGKAVGKAAPYLGKAVSGTNKAIGAAGNQIGKGIVGAGRAVGRGASEIKQDVLGKNFTGDFMQPSGTFGGVAQRTAMGVGGGGLAGAGGTLLSGDYDPAHVARNATIGMGVGGLGVLGHQSGLGGKVMQGLRGSSSQAAPAPAIPMGRMARPGEAPLARLANPPAAPRASPPPLPYDLNVAPKANLATNPRVANAGRRPQQPPAAPAATPPPVPKRATPPKPPIQPPIQPPRQTMEEWLGGRPPKLPAQAPQAQPPQAQAPQEPGAMRSIYDSLPEGTLPAAGAAAGGAATAAGTVTGGIMLKDKLNARNRAMQGEAYKQSGDEAVEMSPGVRMRGWQWKALQQQQAEAKTNWMPRLFSSEATPLTEMLASPGKQGLLHGLLGGAVGAGAGYLGGDYAGVDPTQAALAGGGAGAILGGVHGYGKQRRKNDDVIDVLRRSPPGATMRDYDSVKKQDEKRGDDEATAVGGVGGGLLGGLLGAKGGSRIGENKVNDRFNATLSEYSDRTKDTLAKKYPRVVDDIGMRSRSFDANRAAHENAVSSRPLGPDRVNHDAPVYIPEVGKAIARDDVLATSKARQAHPLQGVRRDIITDALYERRDLGRPNADTTGALAGVRGDIHNEVPSRPALGPADMKARAEVGGPGNDLVKKIIDRAGVRSDAYNKDMSRLIGAGVKLPFEYRRAVLPWAKGLGGLRGGLAGGILGSVAGMALPHIVGGLFKGSGDAADDPFAEAFFARFHEAGCTAEQIKEAVDGVEREFGVEVVAGLRSHMAKVAGPRDFFGKAVGPAVEWGKKLITSPSMRKAPSPATSVRSTQQSLFPGVSGGAGGPQVSAARPIAPAPQYGPGSPTAGNSVGSHVAGSSVGALAGGFTGKDDPSDVTFNAPLLGPMRFNPGRAAMGAAAFNPALRSATGRLGGPASVAARGFQHSIAGRLGGGGLDAAAGLFNVDTGGRLADIGGTVGGLSGGVSRAGSLMRTHGTPGGVAHGIGSALHSAGNKGTKALWDFGRGAAWDPMTAATRWGAKATGGLENLAAGRKLTDGGAKGNWSNWAVGRYVQPHSALAAPSAMSTARTLGRAVGFGGMGLAAAAGTHNLAQGYAENTANNAMGKAYMGAKPYMEQDMADFGDNYLATRGMLGDDGQLDLTRNVNPGKMIAQGLSGAMRTGGKGLADLVGRMSPYQAALMGPDASGGRQGPGMGMPEGPEGMGTPTPGFGQADQHVATLLRGSQTPQTAGQEGPSGYRDEFALQSQGAQNAHNRR